MKKFNATTKSGTTYTSNGETITVHPRDGYPYTLKPITLKNVDRRDDLFPYAAIEAADTPEVGKSIYILAFTDWRLSTEVVKVEVTEELAAVEA